MKQKKLVIISVPIMRIARVTLSADFLSLLKEKADIVIVSPFSDEDGFRKNFSSESIYFVQWDDKKISSVKQKLLKVPDLIRRMGYWRKFKKMGLGYYVKNMYVRFEPNGHDHPLNWLMKVLYFFFSFVGKNQVAWKAAEWILGSRWFKFPALSRFCESYDEVTLIQSANWGLQDRALARISSKNSWRKVLVPYTTDQLFANGFLVNKFDAVCVQGAFELQYAQKFHALPDKKIHYLGSAWFRYLSKINLSLAETQESDVGLILYAGVLNTYFPIRSELMVVDALIDFVRKQNMNLKVIYRPVIFDPVLRDLVEKKYGSLEVIELHWPDAAVIGLDEYQEVNQEESLQKYAEDLKHCKLLVMSRSTSLFLDAAYVAKCGVISNMIDDGDVLSKRHSQELYNNETFPGVNMAHTLEQLLEYTQEILGSPQLAYEQAELMLSGWDYPKTDFKATLLEACFGD